VPYEGAVKAQFLPAEIGKADYPGLMAGRASVDIVASPAVLVARPSQDPERRAALDRFVPAFLTALNAGALKDAKWREVNPVARVPIARLPSAQDWIDKRRTN
jgi:hypothetical protein